MKHLESKPVGFGPDVFEAILAASDPFHTPLVANPADEVTARRRVFWPGGG